MSKVNNFRVKVNSSLLSSARRSANRYYTGVLILWLVLVAAVIHFIVTASSAITLVSMLLAGTALLAYGRRQLLKYVRQMKTLRPYQAKVHSIR